MIPLLTCVCVLAAVAGLIWLRLPVESSPPQPATILFERVGAAPTAARIPRRLWSYWHDDEVPLVVRRCLENWRRHCPGWEVELVLGSSLHRHVDPALLPAGFARMTPARRSDWLRLYLLAHHGGVWVDASTILTESLEWMRAAQSESGAGYVGYYLDGFCTPGRPPVLESWCMAAPPDMPFVRAWLAELGRALAAGDEAYLDALRRQGRYERLVQRISRPAYLVVHICAQAVLDEGLPCRLLLWRAEDTAYFLQQVSHWRRLRLYRRLLAHPAPARPPRLMKLRGGERNKLEGYFAHHIYRSDSIVGRYLPEP
jgi:hypothetical protein